MSQPPNARRSRPAAPGLRRLKERARGLALTALKWLGQDLDTVSLDGALRRCRQRTGAVGTVLDVGASDGRWTEVCRRYFPEAYYLLIEAQRPHEPALAALKRSSANLDYVIAAAGDTQGEIYFDATDLLGGIASHTPFPENGITVPVTTLDREVQQRRLAPPYFLKLDTHGFEVPILAGARATLAQTALLMIETYNFNFSAENLRFHQMVAHLETLGLRCVDLCDPLPRRRDGALWQFDLFFAPANSPTFASESYY